MEEGLSYWAPPEENPNFVSRPPDPGMGDLLKTVGWESLYHSPFYATMRFSELSLEKSPTFNASQGTPTPLLSADDANQKYGLAGQLKFEEPINESAAKLMYDRKIDENDRAYLIASGQNTGARKAASFGVGMAATLLDPINFAAMFIPVVGEARIARMAEGLGGSVLKQRLAQGALTGLSGAAMVEPFILIPALQEQANYNLTDSALNLGFGAALGGMLHAGMGAVADRLRTLKPRDADTIFEAAMNNVLKDEPVTAPAKVAEFVDELQPTNEVVAAAAIQLEDGTVLTGKNHARIVMENPDAFDGRDLTEFAGNDGFVTNTGRYIDREEAMQLASSSGQLRPELQERIDSGDMEPLAAEDLNIEGSNVFPPGFNAFTGERGMSLNDTPLRDANGRFLSKEKRLELLNEKIQAQQIQDNGSKNVYKDTKEISSSLPKDDLRMTGESDNDIKTIESQTAELEANLSGGYFYHLDSSNAPIESFRAKGILPSKSGYEGPGVYLAVTPEQTEVYGSLSKNTLYRVSKKKLVKQFGTYSKDNPTGVQGGTGGEDALLAGNRAIPPELVEVKKGNKWIPLAQQAEDALAKFEEELAQEIGDPVAREAGVKAGINCIIRNLL